MITTVFLLVFLIDINTILMEWGPFTREECAEYQERAQRSYDQEYKTYGVACLTPEEIEEAGLTRPGNPATDDY